MEGKSFDKKRTRRSLFVRCGNNNSFAAAKKKVRPSVRGATRTAANLFDGPSFVKPNRERRFLPSAPPASDKALSREYARPLRTGSGESLVNATIEISSSRRSHPASE